MTGAKTLETHAELDSGAEYSLFDGQLAVDIGLPLRRNILGRDFFDLLTVGFDEHHSEVYLGEPR
jgi:hypothetical protein